MTTSWRSLAPEELERQYNARATVADVDAELRAYRLRSSPMYALPECRAGLAYGPGADETLDLFLPTDHPDAPLFVFVHGGYWRALHSADSVFMAQTLLAHGVAVASINYTLAPQATLEQMVDQCRRALLWLHGPQARAQGLDQRRTVVAGSSAGAHLAAMLLEHHWLQASGLAPTLVGGVLLSGLYALEPLLHCRPQQWLQLDIARAHTLSPLLHLPSAALTLRVLVAEQDTEEFKRQSRDYAAACAAQGNPVSLHEVAERNHFDIVLDWMDPATQLSRCTLALCNG